VDGKCGGEICRDRGKSPVFKGEIRKKILPTPGEKGNSHPPFAFEGGGGRGVLLCVTDEVRKKKRLKGFGGRGYQGAAFVEIVRGPGKSCRQLRRKPMPKEEYERSRRKDPSSGFPSQSCSAPKRVKGITSTS